MKKIYIFLTIFNLIAIFFIAEKIGYFYLIVLVFNTIGLFIGLEKIFKNDERI
jgi:hypothetical protein